MTMAISKKKLAATPELRFSEFREKWVSSKFTAIAGKVTDSFNPAKEVASLPCIELESLDQNTGQILNLFDSRELKSIKTKFKIGDVLFGKLRPYLNKFAKPNFDGVCTSEIWVFRPKSISTDFLFTLVQTPNFFKVATMQSGSKMPRANWALVSQTKFLIPTDKDEHEKIANFFGAVDAKIAQLSRKRDLLTDYKKGCMKKIFSQELRFKDDDGNDFPDWETKPLQLVGKRKTEKNINFEYKSVLTNSATQGVVLQSDYFDTDVAKAGNIDGYYIVKKGDFVYNPRVSATAPVGPIKRNNLIDGVMSPLYTIFILFEDGADFYEHFFSSTSWYKYMKQVANVGARHDRMAISTKDFLNLPMPCPHPAEQKKIVTFLSAINTKIDLADRELASAKKFKQGLLQQMFV